MQLLTHTFIHTSKRKLHRRRNVFVRKLVACQSSVQTERQNTHTHNYIYVCHLCICHTYVCHLCMFENVNRITGNRIEHLLRAMRFLNKYLDYNNILQCATLLRL